MNQVWTTRDLDLVAALEFHGILPIRVKYKGKIAIFSFEMTPEFIEKKSMHYDDKLMVPSQSNGWIRKSLKHRHELIAEKTNNEQTNSNN